MTNFLWLEKHVWKLSFSSLFLGWRFFFRCYNMYFNIKVTFTFRLYICMFIQAICATRSDSFCVQYEFFTVTSFRASEYIAIFKYVCQLVQMVSLFFAQNHFTILFAHTIFPSTVLYTNEQGKFYSFATENSVKMLQGLFSLGTCAFDTVHICCIFAVSSPILKTIAVSFSLFLLCRTYEIKMKIWYSKRSNSIKNIIKMAR